MIAAVKGWSAVLSALLFFIPAAARAADDLGSAARDLARKTAAFVGRNEPVSISWRNLSSLGAPELTTARTAFEAVLTQSGVRLGETPSGAEAKITLSENQNEELLVEELRKGEERQVWITSWKRAEQAAPQAPAATLEKKLVWEQDEPMLDVAFPPGGMLVLTKSNLILLAQAEGRWQAKATVPFTLPKPWPRDPRARLRIHGAAFEGHLPGANCTGALEPALSFECRATDESWVLESGSRAILLAAFTANRNYFDGRVTAQTGQRKTVPPFYSAASIEEQGRALWLFAQVDGKVQIFDSAWEPAGSISGWGSDVAGVDARCGGGSAVLATRAGDGSAMDAIQAFALINRTPLPLAPPAELPGPVVALWPSGGSAAVAIVQNPGAGKYEAYVFTVVCE